MVLTKYFHIYFGEYDTDQVFIYAVTTIKSMLDEVDVRSPPFNDKNKLMLPAKTFASAIRNHWAIENQNHWVRDVTLAEDASRIRINPGIMARLRSQTLNIARANGVTNIANALWNRRSRSHRQPLIQWSVTSVEQPCPVASPHNKQLSLMLPTAGWGCMSPQYVRRSST